MDKNLTTDGKLDCIFELEEADSLSVNDWNTIESLILDDDSEVRLRVSELLALFPSNRSESLLLTLLKDPDYLVRASACDSLSFSKSSDTLHLLMNSTKDKRYLVRGYAVLSIGDVQRNSGSNSSEIIEFLKNLEQKEPSEWVKIALFRSLFVLNQYSYGDNLLCMIESRYYRNRCFTISLLEQLVDRNLTFKMPRMESVLQQRLKIEKAYSVKLKLSNLLEVLSKAK